MSLILGILDSGVTGGGGGGFTYDSIQTVTVGSGGAANVEFTSIPATYKHLQIRGISRNSGSGISIGRVRFNSDTGTNYARHTLEGDGASAGAFGSGTTSFMQNFVTDSTASIFGATVIDILDYANTNKYKTVRSLSGVDTNGSGRIYFQSGLWLNTNAITSITLYDASSNLAQYSQFALYGIKGS